MSDANGTRERAKQRQAASSRHAKLVGALEGGSTRLAALAEAQSFSTEEARATVESMVVAVDEDAEFFETLERMRDGWNALSGFSGR